MVEFVRSVSLRWILSRSRLVLLLLLHLLEDGQQIVDADQVAVLVVADHPARRVVDRQPRRQPRRLGEVDQPHVGVGRVVHEQQRAADHLVVREELGHLQRRPNRFQPLNVLGLKNRKKYLTKILLAAGCCAAVKHWFKCFVICCSNQ